MVIGAYNNHMGMKVGGKLVKSNSSKNNTRSVFLGFSHDHSRTETVEDDHSKCQDGERRRLTDHPHVTIHQTSTLLLINTYRNSRCYHLKEK